MDFKVNLSPVAIGDLEAIVAYIAKDNPDAAFKFGDALLTRTFRLASMPEMDGYFALGRVESFVNGLSNHIGFSIACIRKQN
jgi:plasmid stabilization system protein ParE